MSSDMIVVLGFKQNAFKHKWDVDIIPVTPQLQAEEKYDTYILKNGYCGAFSGKFCSSR